MCEKPWATSWLGFRNHLCRSMRHRRHLHENMTSTLCILKGKVIEKKLHYNGKYSNTFKIHIIEMSQQIWSAMSFCVCVCVCERASCSPGWPWTCYSVRISLSLEFSSCLCLLRVVSTDVYRHAWFMCWWGWTPGLCAC